MRIVGALAGIMAVLLIGAPTAGAVWGGQVDTSHPAVGALYVDFDSSGTITADDLLCSGSYAGVSKDGLYGVFLTAGHCLPGPGDGIAASELRVSFDPNAGDGVSAPVAAVAYHQMPGFGHDAGDRRDLGIVLLPLGSGSGLTPVRLATAGLLDTLKARGELTFLRVDIVGYGVVPTWDGPGPTTFAFDGVRRSGTSVVTGLTRSALIFNQNRHGIGTGSGLCFGDSGSPQFLKGTNVVVSVTSGGNGQCNASNQNYRVDTPLARAFLGRFLALP
jgi:hypothetical protein